MTMRANRFTPAAWIAFFAVLLAVACQEPRRPGGAVAPPSANATDEDGRLYPEGLGPFADQIVAAMGTRAEREARAPYSPKWWPLEVGDTISDQRWWLLGKVERWNGLSCVFWLDTLVFTPVYREVWPEGDPVPLGVAYEGHFPRKSFDTPDDSWWQDVPPHLEGESATDIERWFSDPDNSYPDWGATAAEKAMWTRERWLEGWTGPATKGGSG